MLPTDKLTNQHYQKHNLLCQGGKKRTLSSVKYTDPPTGVCLVMAGELTQDLSLILSTKNTEQNKTKKRKPKQESIYYKRSGDGFIVQNICCVLLKAITSLKMPILKKTMCVTTTELHEEHQDEDMPCFTASLIVKKI